MNDQFIKAYHSSATEEQLSISLVVHCLEGQLSRMLAAVAAVFVGLVVLDVSNVYLLVHYDRLM